MALVVKADGEDVHLHGQGKMFLSLTPSRGSVLAR